MILTPEESIRHLARFRIKFVDEEGWAEGSGEYLFYEDATEWCWNEITQYDVWLPDSFEIYRSYDGGETWAVCGDVKWDLITMKALASAEDWQDLNDDS